MSTAMTPGVAVGQVWERKSDGALIVVRELTGSSHSFVRVQNLRTGRHFDVTAPQIQKRYAFEGYEAVPTSEEETNA